MREGDNVFAPARVTPAAVLVNGEAHAWRLGITVADVACGSDPTTASASDSSAHRPNNHRVWATSPWGRRSDGDGSTADRSPMPFPSTPGWFGTNAQDVHYTLE